MPMLGGIDAMHSSSPSRRRRRTFGFASIPRLRMQNVLIALIGLLVLRNFMRTDYREEGLKHLKEGGMTKEEVLKLFPQTKGDKDVDVGHMKDDIALLKEEMKSLRAAVGKSEVKAAAAVKDVREEVLKQMDEIHLRKRKEKDEKLAKEHPDFQATRKMRGN